MRHILVSRKEQKKVSNIVLVLLISLGLFTILPTFTYAAQPIYLGLNEGKLIKLPKPANNMFIAEPTVADFQVKSARVLYLYAKSLGSTTFFALDEKGNEIVHYKVTVTPNLSSLRRTLNTLLPKHKIRVSSLGDSIVLKGSVRSPKIAEDARRIATKFSSDPAKVLNFLEVDSPAQINLRVMVVEMSREVNRNIGLDWSAMYQSSNSSVSLKESFRIADLDTTNIKGTGLFQFGSFSVLALIEALDEEGLVTVLSEPNLTALSGETATFLAGGEFPILIPDLDDIALEFKQFGVSLAFTPTLLNDETINLQVRPEVSQLSNVGAIQFGGFSVPSLSTRRAETTVELKSGQSFAIAGLLDSSVTHDINKFPGLGDIPVLGRLFRSDEFKRGETELVIIVTPYLVKPASTKDFKYPSEMFGIIDYQNLRSIPRNKIGYIVS